jgi:hypothetical protein
MRKVSIQVRNGATRFGVAVQTESIERAVGLAGALHTKSDLWVRFPIDPEGTSVEGASVS